MIPSPSAPALQETRKRFNIRAHSRVARVLPVGPVGLCAKNDDDVAPARLCRNAKRFLQAAGCTRRRLRRHKRIL